MYTILVGILFAEYESCQTAIFLSVPPRIVDSLSSSDMVQTEGSNVSLECVARGSPQPDIVWRREDGREISINKNTTGEVSHPELPFQDMNNEYIPHYDCLVCRPARSTKDPN